MLKTIMKVDIISRRSFIKIIGIGLTGLGIQPTLYSRNFTEFPTNERLGRVCVGMVDIKAQPSEASQTVGVLYEDAVVPWLREVVAKEPNFNRYNQRWVETLDGFVYSINIQPVRNIPNKPIDALLQSSRGEGMWAEVTVPYADINLVNNPSSNSWVS